MHTPNPSHASKSDFNNQGFGKTILMLVTSCDMLHDTQATGVYFEDFAEPYMFFRSLGFWVEVASIQGGQAPVDPQSLATTSLSVGHEHALLVLKDTRILDQSLQESALDALFLPGGPGSLLDLSQSKLLQSLIVHMLSAKKPVGIVGHAAAALLNIKNSDATAMVKGRQLTCFSKAEEHSMGLDALLPRVLQDELAALESVLNITTPDTENCVIDGSLITGQNSVSAGSVAVELVQMLQDLS